MPDDAAALSVGDERVVEIGPVAHGGHFIAHSDGRTLFVRHALPGETVRVRVTEIAKRIVRADALEILYTSPDRVPAPCRWAGPGACGGCDFQHVSMTAQRRLKTQVLVESLQRFGHIAPDDPVLSVALEELPGAPDGLRWRSRMTWAQAPDGIRGLHPHRSHDVIAVDDCLIAQAGISSPEAPVPGRVDRTVGDRTWRIADGDFWQVHPELPDALVGAVLALGEPSHGETWWDLYAGAGLFSAFLGESVGPQGTVEAVETSGDALRAARRALYDLPNVHLHQADVGAWLGVTDAASPDGVVLDPPRAGAGAKVVAAVAGRRPSRVVYVGCDPVALSRDVALFAGFGYRLEGVQAFDAFPMTHHFESVARLRRAEV
jgi:tRNA/tmRNA/rRNA uracil-C5-methylase (TrmA/RlmC/RlmD family)